MADYREIYNQVFEKEQRYNLAENSPGLRAVIKATDYLSVLNGRSLDIGCGVGFAVEYLSKPNFDFRAFGVDISDVSIDRAKMRLEAVPGINQRLKVVDSQELPFDDHFFSLVTCFDVLEHLELIDIESTLVEIDRVLKPGALFFASVSCRASNVLDINGDNLHRTIRSVDWWIDKVNPDRIEYDVHRSQLTFWKRKPAKTGRQPASSQSKAAKMEPSTSKGVEFPAAAGGSNSAQLYQKIYDENPWYGNADEGRCPGVRLLPHYKDWLIGPVLDLGCGRGQTVEQLRGMGFDAEGIDQIQINSEMRVGDITQPVHDINKFRSVICIDCIEHLREDQLLGLFENMKQVKRQAFSIHNGESTGTGVELHINRQSFVDWDKLIRNHFEIAAVIKVHDEQMLYLTQEKQA